MPDRAKPRLILLNTPSMKPRRPASIDMSALPTWAALNSSTGAITGTVSGSAGTATFTLHYGTATSDSLTITTSLAPSITTASPLPAGAVNSTYSQTLAATGGTGTLTWSVSTGTVPTGLTLSSAGLLAGTPTTTTGSPFTFTAVATDTNGVGGTKSFTVTITATLCTITTASLPNAVVGQAYSQTAQKANCAASTWTVSSGTLPSWASLNSSTGAITGTPLAASVATFTLHYDTANSGTLIITTSNGVVTVTGKVTVSGTAK